MATDEEIRRDFAIFMNELRMKEAFKSGKFISQTEMARRIGIPQGSLSQYEKGTRVPDTENAHKIAAYAGVKVYDILEMPRSLPNDIDLIAVATCWPDISKGMRKRVRQMIEEEFDMLHERMKSLAGEVKKS